MLIVLVPGMALFYVGLDTSSLLDPVSLIAGGALAILGLAFAATIIIAVFNLWLTPYITGTQALFYTWTQGRDVSARPDPFSGGQGGWGQPYDYTWTSGPTSGTGTGIGPGPKDDGHTPPPPKPPRPPRDDPWE